MQSLLFSEREQMFKKNVALALAMFLCGGLCSLSTGCGGSDTVTAPKKNSQVSQDVQTEAAKGDRPRMDASEAMD
jgi:hypothetical protein